MIRMRRFFGGRMAASGGESGLSLVLTAVSSAPSTRPRYPTANHLHARPRRCGLGRFIERKTVLWRARTSGGFRCGAAALAIEPLLPRVSLARAGRPALGPR